MSRDYRKWKEDRKKFRRGELFPYEDGYIILLTDTSMAAYKRLKRERRRKLRLVSKIRRNLEQFCRKNNLDMPVWHYSDSKLLQVSEEEQIRQANKYWRQNEKKEDNRNQG